MPQLNPAPWFTTMVTLWITLLLLLLPKMLMTHHTLAPLKTKQANKLTTWIWPWQ
uniref:ATP synthase complex subunit 8 n=1 Tax=Ptyodactylus guttatus TaxID=502503 RepID=A0A1Y1CF16_9SAUR|nr:ATP synthase F0 subunit 8 [Ptyodactylus guttatus]BAX77901.1 ATPase subunit 8 [Ptyodactylus guttatus]